MKIINFDRVTIFITNEGAGKSAGFLGYNIAKGDIQRGRPLLF